MPRINRKRCTAMANMLTLAPQRHAQNTYLSPKPQNECGTVGCVAGWGYLWKNGKVEIEPDGTMTWNVESMIQWYGAGTRTLAPLDDMPDYYAEAKEWFGLTDDAAHMLFIKTLAFLNPNALAIEVLRRLGDGRLNNRTLTTRALARISADLPLP